MRARNGVGAGSIVSVLAMFRSNFWGWFVLHQVADAGAEVKKCSGKNGQP